MRKLLPILLLIAGIIVFAFGVVSAVGNVSSSLSTIGEPWRVPGQTSAQLEPGDYVLYENVGFQSSDSAPPTIDADTVLVEGPTGRLPVGCVYCSGSMTVSLGADTYSGVASFTVPETGRYTIEADGDGQQVVIGPSVFSTAGSAAMGIGLAMLGGLLALIGVIWLVVALVTGRKPATAAAAGAPAPAPGSPAAAPAGWYPDPDNPSGLRYWNGSAWTDDRHQG